MKNSYFILTRFNLNLYPRDKRQMPTRTRQWLEHRFEVFERYCLPSVVAQTEKNFTWLCLFDTQTPDEYRSRIEGYSRICPQFRAVWYDAEQAASLTESLRATLLDCKSSESEPGNCLPPPRPELSVTINLDNDDALSADAVEMLRNSVADSSERRVYSFLYGYQYFIDSRFLIRMRYPHNHFLALAEPFDSNLQTILAYNHTRAVFQLPTTYIRSRDGQWLEIVHKDNVSNDFRINIKIWNIPVLRSRSLADFGLGDLRVGWWEQWLKTLFLLPAQFVTTGVERLWRKRERKRFRQGGLS